MANMLLATTSDTDLANADKKYLEKHGINLLMNSLVQALVRDQPKEPLEYLVQFLSSDNKEQIEQDINDLKTERKECLTNLFRAMDKDTDDNLTVEEIKNYLKVEEGSEEEEDLVKSFKSMGKDIDSRLTLEDFLSFYSRATRAMSDKQFFQFMAGSLEDTDPPVTDVDLTRERREAISMLFDGVDSNGSGSISIPELGAYLGVEVGSEDEEDLVKAFQALDKAADERISLNEFTAYYHKATKAMTDQQFFQYMASVMN